VKSDRLSLIICINPSFTLYFGWRAQKLQRLRLKFTEMEKSSMVLKHQVNVENLKATALVIKIASNKKP